MPVMIKEDFTCSTGVRCHIQRITTVYGDRPSGIDQTLRRPSKVSSLLIVAAFVQLRVAPTLIH